jgi:hypothetical protein
MVPTGVGWIRLQSKLTKVNSTTPPAHHLLLVLAEEEER